jgi:diguanylate cyclase (GGDEF)-like protein
MSGRRGLVALGFVLFAVLAAVGFQLHAAQRDRVRDAERRFEQRAQISAALTQSVFGALGSVGAQEMSRTFGGPPDALGPRLAQMIRHNKLGYVAILDGRGTVLAHRGPVVPHTQRRLPGVLSDVRSSSVGPLVEYSLPIAVPGGRRMLVEGLPLALVRSFLENYLRRLPNPDGATLTIADRGGSVLARVAPKGRVRTTHHPLSVAATIDGTTWRLRLRAERASVLARARGGAWLAWSLLAGLALALVAGIWLGARVLRSNRALRESEGKLRGLVGALEEAVFLHHADGHIELLNASARAMAGTELDVIASPSRESDWRAVSDDGLPIEGAQTPVGRSFADGTPQRDVIGLDHAGHERRWVDVSTRPLTRPGESAPYAVVCSCTDVTERQNLEAHLLDLADRDPLTGLWNRRRFEQDLEQQLGRCRRYGERAALMVLDIDGFKQVNDELGHLAGDELLCELATALSSRLRASDRAARLGGDEFAVLLLCVDEEDTEKITQDLATRLRDAAEDRIPLSISIGVSLLGPHTGSVNDALQAADRAMYVEKQRRVTQRSLHGALRPPAGATGEMASLRALLAAVNARDSYTASHSREVVRLARGVSRSLGLGESETAEVEHVALLHDVGKIAIPDAILRKARSLTEHEQTLMRQHPVVGAEILASTPELAHLAPAVRAEHERWDGGGYPDGLTGDAIPIASRIVFVCDAYHAMTSDRPYRRAMSADQAREEIARSAGTQFCPVAAAALLDVLTLVQAPA